MSRDQSRRKVLGSIGMATIGLGALSGTGVAESKCKGEAEITSGGTVQGIYIPEGANTIEVLVDNSDTKEMSVEYWVGTMGDRDNKASEITIPAYTSWNRPFTDLIPTEDIWIVAEGAEGSVSWGVQGVGCWESPP